MNLGDDIEQLVKVLRVGNELHIKEENFDFAFRTIAHICGFHNLTPELLGDIIERQMEKR